MGGGLAAVNGTLGTLDVHAGLQWSARAHEQNADPNARGARAHGAVPDVGSARGGDALPRAARAVAPPTSVVAHVAWTVGERFAVTGDSQQPCLVVWERNERAE